MISRKNVFKNSFLLKMIILLTVISLTVFSFNNTDLIKIFRIEISIYPFGKVYLIIGVIFLIINMIGILWYLFNFMKYKEANVEDDENLPFCTVIVPSYNEGSQVKDTLISVYESEYPKEKLQIIAVDDGSVDDTWDWIIKSKISCNNEISVFKLKKNMGKKEALVKGFKESKGDIIVTIDSDSIINKFTLKNIVSPFVKDKNIGAVAGGVRVLNKNAGLIPRILDVVFTFSFDFIRSAQSNVNSVMCTPGALSAYRKNILIDVMDEWKNQMFMGFPSKIGEDRALTNLVLKNGYSVKYQQNAIVYTNVPVKWFELCKMLLRWERSNVRETIELMKFVFRDFRSFSANGLRINFIFDVFNVLKGQLMLIFTFFMFLVRPIEMGFIFWNGSIVILLFSFLFYTLKNRDSEGIWIFCYGIYWFLGLSWITTYALLTPQNSSWMTREKPKKVLQN